MQLTPRQPAKKRRYGFLPWPAFWGLIFWIAASAFPAGAVTTIADFAILVDMATGRVLFEKNSDQQMPPASMSKMMTVYMLFERLRDGSLTLDDTFRVSENAWRRGGAKSGSSTMFLEPGKRVRVQDLIRGIIVQSGNDACIVVAEGLASSEAAFAEEMTTRAQEMGMTNTAFKNATGWPAPGHLSSARDLALLAEKTIRDFPEYYPYYSEKEFTYNTIRQTNRNPLLYSSDLVDGLKTGHTLESGYGLTASAVKGDRRLILVVNGLPSKKARRTEPDRLLEWGFREFNNYKLFIAGEKVTDADVWLGQQASVPLLIENEMLLTLPRKARRKMKVRVLFESPVPAPVSKGDRVAKLVVSVPGDEPVEVPLVAANDVPRLGLIGRLGTALQAIIWGDSR
ncbi:MAG: D-alanyl-D-alanine carboxypeptidase [Alphaproteobacteria bacterium]|jgi:serine-type D-Ala-D-Ala carboxypeptidase (penicillin-binding protein 5/6)|nr:D-alanyl-D-alanine carboxypeptidase [Alphaproteobacteria bacterium]